MLVLGPGSIHLVTAANLWPRYDHIESCVVNARLLIMCDTAFYAIIHVFMDKNVNNFMLSREVCILEGLNGMSLPFS